MKRNENTVLIGSQILLVPYKLHHVEKYHHWMKSSLLQHLTASEPLTLQQEYEMQQTWHTDADKCTFIILSKKAYQESNGNEIKAMIGDVNLFLHEQECEVEVMIAEETYRRKGMAYEAVSLLLSYAIQVLNWTRFEAKIGIENEASLRLFQRLGFIETNRVAIFNEITMSCSSFDALDSLIIEPYDTLTFKSMNES